MKKHPQPIDWPQGFQATGMHCGIKHEKKDLALFYSETPAAVAGTFTTNQVQAAPVKLCRQRIRTGSIQALVVNSGNANACTGPQGMQDAETMARLVGASLSISPTKVLVCSTGHIGHPLPMEKFTQGIPEAASRLSRQGYIDAAEAILTTDTHRKLASVKVMVGDTAVLLTIVAKGSGMIEPNMATMLAFCFTDAAVQPAALQSLLSDAVEQSFNRITVDGDRSTNDTVLLLANGQAGNDILSPTHTDWPAFREALFSVTLDAAKTIVQDGEGATKVVTVHVTGARSETDAEEAARAVANSSLIKTSWAGGQANWGRVMDAVGYSRAMIVEEAIDIDYDGQPAVRGGLYAGTNQEALDQITQQDSFTLGIDLHQGSGEAMVYSCDTTEEYVRINVEE